MNPATAKRAGVYVHFPWCLAKCPYCDFVSYVGSIDHVGYADAVLRELDARAPFFHGRRIESVFFGGGTPSLWETRELGRVLSGVRRVLGADGDIEVTVECNPTSFDEDKARALTDVGVSRVSIGVQSLRDDRLRFLGRLHDARGAQIAILGAVRAGVPRVSADIIFGLPEQTPAEACVDVKRLTDLGLAHLSCYQLTIEAGTRFGELARRGRLPLAEDGAVADSFIAIDELLTAGGFRHYEISNFARPGEEARHNLGYWRGDEYLGLGCAAVGFVRTAGAAEARGVRWRNVTIPEQYIETSRGPRELPPKEDMNELLDAETLMRERIMLGLRTDEGLDFDAAARDLGLARGGWTPARIRAAAWLEERHRIVRDRSLARVPRAAWLWADDTAARLF
jgi:putative oxygen-independent coproporphyrinogen III oxidase